MQDCKDDKDHHFRIRKMIAQLVFVFDLVNLAAHMWLRMLKVLNSVSPME